MKLSMPKPSVWAQLSIMEQKKIEAMVMSREIGVSFPFTYIDWNSRN